MEIQTDIAKYRYLVVDDDILIRGLIVIMLKQLGAEHVDAADDGKSAIALMKHEMPDIIVCDLNMPEMDGAGFVRHLARKNFSGGVILISSTAVEILDIVMNLASAQRLNVLGSLPKPFPPEDLVALLARFDGMTLPLASGK
jgi:CheY-like chemotaxis protein